MEYVVHMTEKRNTDRVLVGKPEGNTSHGKPRHRLQPSVKLSSIEIKWEDEGGLIRLWFLVQVAGRCERGRETWFMLNGDKQQPADIGARKLPMLVTFFLCIILKLKTWQEVTTSKIMLPMLFTETPRSYYYVQLILTLCVRELTEDKDMVTSRSVTTAHTPNFSMTATDELLGEWLWPPRPPELNLCNSHS
jgi:hypothetical protein